MGLQYKFAGRVLLSPLLHYIIEIFTNCKLSILSIFLNHHKHKTNIFFPILLKYFLQYIFIHKTMSINTKCVYELVVCVNSLIIIIS